MCAARRRAALKTKKLRNVGKSKSTDTEDDDVEEEEGMEENEVVGEDGNSKLNDSFVALMPPSHSYTFLHTFTIQP